MTTEKKSVSFQLLDTDRKKLEAVRAQLALSASETARRALRIGLIRLEKLKIPGSSAREQAVRNAE